MQKENKGFLIKQILLLLWTSDEKLTNLFEKKRFGSLREILLY